MRSNSDRVYREATKGRTSLIALQFTLPIVRVSGHLRPNVYIRSFPIHERKKSKAEKGRRKRGAVVLVPRNRRGTKKEREKRRERKRNARRKRRGRFLGTASIFKLVRPCAGTRGGNGERAEEGRGSVLAALSEFVRLKIYPMCTVYQAVAISIGARVCTPSLLILSIYLSLFLSFSFFSLFLSSFVLSIVFSQSFTRSFFKGVPFCVSRLDERSFFLSRRDLRSFRVFNIIRGSSIIPTIERTEVEVKEIGGRRRVFYLRRCYKLFRIVKNSGRMGDSAGRTYGIFHYGSSFALFFSTQHFLPSCRQRF